MAQNLTQLLTLTQKDVSFGDVMSSEGKNLYKVNVNGIPQTIKSLVTPLLSVGTKVLIASTQEGIFIVGVEHTHARQPIEVTILL